MIGPAIEATPWALPGAAVAVVLAVLVNGWLAHRTGGSRSIAFLFTLATAAIVVVTLTPSLDGGFWGRSRVVSLEFNWPALNSLLTVSETSLNVLLFIPLGLAAVLVPCSSARRSTLAIAWLFPVAAETLHYALPVLGRSGFLLDDVIANLIGVAIGTAVGLMLHLIRLAFESWMSPATIFIQALLVIRP